MTKQVIEVTGGATGQGDSALDGTGKINANFTEVYTHVESVDNPHNTTAAQVGADTIGTASGLMSAHTSNLDPHTQYAKHVDVPTAAQKGALDNANNPSSGNTFITQADIVGGLPTGQIPNNFVNYDSDISGLQTTTSNSFVDITGMDLTVTTSSAVPIVGYFTYTASKTGGGSDTTAAFRIARVDGANAPEYSIGMQTTINTGSSNENGHVTFRTTVTLVTGTYTFRPQFRRVSGSDTVQFVRGQFFIEAMQAPKGEDAPAGGTVLSVGVSNTNGFTGSVTNPTTTPVITVSTNVNGIVKGNGTAISAATAGTDYSMGTSALSTGIVKSTTSTGALTIAVAGDFPMLNQSTTGSAATLTTGRTITLTGGVSGVSGAFNGSSNLSFAANLAAIQPNTQTWSQTQTFTEPPVFTDQVGTRTALSLGNVNNTSDVSKPVSTSQQTALDLKANLASPIFTGTVGLPAGQVVNGVTLSTAQGTGTFLRGDGTYAAPGGDVYKVGTPSNNQIGIWTGDGTIEGTSSLTWDNSTSTLRVDGSDAEIQLVGVTSEPTAAPAGELKIYSKSVAGRMMLKMVGSAGIDTVLQPALFGNNTCLWTPTTATAGLWQGTAGAGAGTFSTGLPTVTNFYTAMKRARWANVVTTANQVLGQRNTENMFFRGSVTGQGGFFFFCRFGLDVWTTGNRLFVGMATASTVISAEPSALNNTVGFCVDAVDSSISFLTRGTVATKTPIAGQPTLANNQGYDAYIFCPPNGTEIFYRLDNLNTGATIVFSSTSATLPTNTTMMSANALMSNAANTVVTQAQIGVNRIYVETDR